MLFAFVSLIAGSESFKSHAILISNFRIRIGRLFFPARYFTGRFFY